MPKKIKALAKKGLLIAINFLLILIFFWISAWGILLGYLGLITILSGIFFWIRKRALFMLFSWVLLFFITLLLFSNSLTTYKKKSAVYLEKINSGKRLNTTEKASIYGLNILMCIAAYPLYPEVSKESLYLMFKSDNNIREFESDFFLNSKKIKSALVNKRTHVSWPLNNYVLGHPESRFALALNSCELKYAESLGFTELSAVVNIKYDKKTVAVLMQKPFRITVEEGLFYYLQEEKWLHPYKAVWKTRIP